MSKIEYYQKKPLVLRVVQYTGSNSCVTAIQRMNKLQQDIAQYDDHMMLTTKEGVMRVDLGCFVVQGVKGELYAVQPEIFAELYDPAEPDEEMLEADELPETEED